MLCLRGESSTSCCPSIIDRKSLAPKSLLGKQSESAFPNNCEAVPRRSSWFKLISSFKKEITGKSQCSAHLTPLPSCCWSCLRNWPLLKNNSPLAQVGWEPRDPSRGWDPSGQPAGHIIEQSRKSTEAERSIRASNPISRGDFGVTQALLRDVQNI